MNMMKLSKWQVCWNLWFTWTSPWNQCMSKLKSILGNNSFLNVILYPTITSNWTRVFTQSSPLSHPCMPLPPFPKDSISQGSLRVLYWRGRVIHIYITIYIISLELMANRFFQINLDKDQPYGEKKKNLTGSV